MDLSWLFVFPLKTKESVLVLFTSSGLLFSLVPFFCYKTTKMLDVLVESVQFGVFLVL